MSAEPSNGNGNGKLTTILGGAALIVTLTGGGWKLVQGQFDHQNEVGLITERYQNQIAAMHQDEVRRMEDRLVQQKQELDSSLQREMRLLNDALAKTAEGNDRLSLDRHNFQEQELRELKERLFRLETLNHPSPHAAATP